MGNAPWSVRKRWANGVLKGARGEARRRDTSKGRGAKTHDKTREPREGRITHTHPRNLGVEPCAENKEAVNNQEVPVASSLSQRKLSPALKRKRRVAKHPQTLTCPWRLNAF